MRVYRVTTLEELQEVWAVTHDAYVGAGYITPQPDGIFVHHRDLDLLDGSTRLNPDSEIFYIRGRNGKIIGTCTMTLDGIAGLHCDETFPHETERIRDECRAFNKRLASSWRIVTHNVNPRHRCVVGTLLDKAFEWSKLNDIGVVLCTFNPKHVAFYHDFFGMEPVAESAGEAGLTNAPSVLVRWDDDKSHVWEANVCKFGCD